QRMEELGILAKGPPGRAVLTSSAAPGASAWDDVSRRYFDARIDCPLLEGAACSMYEERPAICREYLVVSPPSSCDSLDGGSRAVERPIRMSEVLVGLGNEHSGAEDPSVPLPLALEWAETHGRRLRARADGEALYWMLMRHVEDAE
ncbi:MAG TPA: YkgJ family cysteine cluster protein, partial [Polyangiaceae bacterium]